MGIRIINVIHPKTGQTTHANRRVDGLYELPDGVVLKKDEIREDRGGGILVFALLFGIGLLIYKGLME